MKTKFSFAWCLLFATVLAASADSYSITVLPGLNFIANQLNNAGGNTLDQILPLAPANLGSYLQKYDVASQSGLPPVNWTGSAWDQTSTLSPGEGAFFYYVSTSDLNLTFTGTPLSSSVPFIPQPNDWQWVSDQLPEVGTWNTIISVPPGAGTVVRRWNPVLQEYSIDTFNGSTWSLGAPTANVGEAWSVYYVPAVVPEPAASALLGVGVAALLIFRRRQPPFAR
jgi:hypothetical protein